MKHTLRAATSLSSIVIPVIVLIALAGLVYFFRGPIISAATSAKDKVAGLFNPAPSSPEPIITPTAFPSPAVTPLPSIIPIQVSQSLPATNLPQSGPAENALASLAIGGLGGSGAWLLSVKYRVKKAARAIFIADKES
jgi:hypothetical protein